MSTRLWYPPVPAPKVPAEPSVSERAVDLVWALLDGGWECEKGSLQDAYCFHCGGEFYHEGEDSGHRKDCPYLTAREFLAGIKPKSYSGKSPIDFGGNREIESGERIRLNADGRFGTVLDRCVGNCVLWYWVEMDSREKIRVKPNELRPIDNA